MVQIVQRFLESFYTQDLWPVLAAYGVHPLAGAYPWISDGERLFLAAGTAGLGPVRPPIDAVLASTCIDHAEADPQRLSASVVADLVQGAAVSCALSVPLLSFLGTGEEIGLVPGGKKRAAAWCRVADMVTDVFTRLRLPAGSQILRSGQARVWDVLHSTVDSDRDRLGCQVLNGLYHFTDGSSFPLGTPFAYYYEYYRYNIAHYRRPVLEHVLGRPLRGILVVENVQQVKAVAVARGLNAGWATEHLVTLPAPGRAGNARATRVCGLSRLDLARLQSVSPERVGELGLAGDHLRFWSTICQLWERLSGQSCPQHTAGEKGWGV